MKLTDTAAVAAIAAGATVGGFLAVSQFAQPAYTDVVEVAEPAGVVEDQDEPVVLPPTVDLLALSPEPWVPPPAAAGSVDEDGGDAGGIDDSGAAGPAASEPEPTDPAPGPTAPPPPGGETSAPEPAPPAEEDRVPEYNDRGEPIPFEPPLPPDEPADPVDRAPDPEEDLPNGD